MDRRRETEMPWVFGWKAKISNRYRHLFIDDLLLNKQLSLLLVGRGGRTEGVRLVAVDGHFGVSSSGREREAPGDLCLGLIEVWQVGLIA